MGEAERRAGHVARVARDDTWRRQPTVARACALLGRETFFSRREERNPEEAPGKERGEGPISHPGEMSALRKLKRRFVLETRPDDNFIKTQDGKEVEARRSSSSVEAIPPRGKTQRGRYRFNKG